jgi:hypothetical protein
MKMRHTQWKTDEKKYKPKKVETVERFRQFVLLDGKVYGTYYGATADGILVKRISSNHLLHGLISFVQTDKK